LKAPPGGAEGDPGAPARGVRGMGRRHVSQSPDRADLARCELAALVRSSTFGHAAGSGGRLRGSRVAGLPQHEWWVDLRIRLARDACDS
jgi:hypothetical protein